MSRRKVALEKDLCRCPYLSTTHLSMNANHKGHYESGDNPLEHCS